MSRSRYNVAAAIYAGDEAALEAERREHCLEFYGAQGSYYGYYWPGPNPYFQSINLCRPENQHGPASLLDPSIRQSFAAKKIVSNVPLISPNQGQATMPLVKPLSVTPTILDPNLLNPWGLVIANDTLWVANGGTGRITCYNLVGAILPTTVNVFGPFGGIAQPTGLAQNKSFESFIINNGPIEGSASLLVCTQDGTIHGYNSSVNLVDSVMLYNGSRNNDVYTGIAVANIFINRMIGGAGLAQYRVTRLTNHLYVCDFFNQRVMAFDQEMRILEDFTFIDEDSNNPIPEDYAPYNVAVISELIYVTYAKQNPRQPQYAYSEQGGGYVSVFTPDGIFLKRFHTRGSLNAPWGICLVPSIFGYPSGSIMIGNQGDGVINIFGQDGRWLGFLGESFAVPLFFDGLRSLVVAPNNQSVYWTSTENNLLTAVVGSVFSRTAASQ
jgi:uncharacterized protein (TIGR03118 family)